MNWNIGWSNEIKRYQQKLEYNQILNKSDRLKIHIVFFKPCSITKTFWGPMAKIKLRLVKKPSNKYSMECYYYLITKM